MYRTYVQKRFQDRNLDEILVILEYNFDIHCSLKRSFDYNRFVYSHKLLIVIKDIRYYFEAAKESDVKDDMIEFFEQSKILETIADEAMKKGLQ